MNRNVLYTIFILSIIVIPIKILLFNSLPFQSSPDSANYIAVSQNISQNACVSLSLPDEKKCRPDWGGNQLFGYPLILSIISFGDLDNLSTAVFFQYLILSLSIIYFCYIIKSKLEASTAAVCLIAILLSLSPFQLAWSRAILTESIVIPLIIVIFASVISDLVDKKLSIIKWSVLLTFAIFVRYELLILCLIVPILSTRLYTLNVATKKTLCVALLVIVPISLWVTRSINQGLIFPPNPKTAHEHIEYPTGVTKWFKTWAYKTEDNPLFIWKIFGGHYNQLRVPDRAFNNEQEKEKILFLLDKLKNHNGSSIPDDINNEFMAIAVKKIEGNPFNYWFFLPAKRVSSMVSDLLYSNNLPIILPEDDAIELKRRISNNLNVTGIVSIIYDYPSNTITRAIIALYKVVIYVFFIFIIFKLPSYQNDLKSLIYCCLSIVLSSILFVIMFAITTETRYLLLSLVSMELSVIITLYSNLGLKFNRSNGKSIIT
ncbi:hypothetical protein [Photobacterium sanguinicancri]|uniref:hypothetical protein n=1 Tax=Photobacterium sanguinicancri TaxID=875932 RepID=UPI003D09AA73